MGDDEFLNVFSEFLVELKEMRLGPNQRHHLLQTLKQRLHGILESERFCHSPLPSFKARKHRSTAADDSLEKISPNYRQDVKSVLEHSNFHLPPPTEVRVVPADSNLQQLLEIIGVSLSMHCLSRHPLKECLHEWDIDHDSVISRTDLTVGLLVQEQLALSPKHIQLIFDAFDQDQDGVLHYFELVQFLQSAMKVEFNDEADHISPIPLRSSERVLLDKFGDTVVRYKHKLKDLFHEIATTLVHAITVDELHKEMHDMSIAASRSNVEAIVRHFNPIGSEPLQLSFSQFVRLCSESSTHNFAEDGTCL